MAQRIAVWYGKDRDLLRLKIAVDRNCDCDRENPNAAACAAHQMLTDQRILDHMAAVKADQQRFIKREHRGS